jgi:glycine hydroxymethyltransferase
MVTSGVRLGSPAGTTRGFGPAEFRQIGDLIADVLDAHAAGSNGDPAKAEAVAREKAIALCRRFPIYRGGR